MFTEYYNSVKSGIFNFKFWPVWLIIVLLYILNTFISNIFVYTDTYYSSLLIDKFDSDRIMSMIVMQNKFQILGYFFIPVVLLIKLWLISGILFIGIYLFNQQVNFKNCLIIILLAEFVSVSAMFLKTIWLIVDMPNTNELQSFYPLSLTQLININNLPKFFYYPLQLVNIFEVTYWFVLAWGVMTFTQQNFIKSFKIVSASYGLALFVWVIFIVFLQFQFT